jgi:3-hydroxyisobutyrate dehydrogenase-like beta-hydroxyacid dehydrogenase
MKVGFIGLGRMGQAIIAEANPFYSTNRRSGHRQMAGARIR